MIEYDYELTRNEEDKIVTYIPNKIPKQMPNLVYIEGPNSSGKSTLLNIIALGLYGLKKDNMAPALKHKLKSLIDESYQELTFDINIRNKDGSLIIKSVKKDANKPFIVHEIINGKKKTLPYDRFTREYNLIYDIPENPTDRLNQLTLSIKELQNEKHNRLRLLRSRIQLVISDVKNSRDPKRIGDLNLEIKKRNEEYDRYEEKIKSNSELLDLLEKYTYCKYYLKYFKDFQELDAKLGNLVIEKKSIKKKISRDNKKIEKLTTITQEEKYNLIDLNMDFIIKLENVFSKEYSNYIKYLRTMDFDDIFQKANFPEYYAKILLNLQNNIIKEITSSRNKSAIEEAMVWEKIISVLEDYKTTDYVVPGIDTKIVDFIKILKDANQKNQKLLEHMRKLEELNLMIDDIQNKIRELEKDVFPNLVEIKEKNGIDVLEQELSKDEEISILNRKLEELTGLCDEYYRECAKKDIPDDKMETIYSNLTVNEMIDPFTKYNENALLEKINSLQKAIQQDKKDQGSTKRFIDLREDEVKRLEKKDPHKFQDKIDDLTKLLQICLSLEQRFVSFNIFITDIINKKYTEDSLKDKEKYLAQVSTYLGRRIGYVKYIDKDYTVNSIDMIKEIIITDEGKKIRFVDMGTGQSQSAYLMGKLNTQDNKKIIALFDEVAMMDKKSLKPVFDRLNELYDSGKLLLGIVVQMGQEMKLRDLSK
ncbi:MAG: AAA family ATPase [Candidatus Heimdallarchaeota archaeon]